MTPMLILKWRLVYKRKRTEERALAAIAAGRVPGRSGRMKTNPPGRPESKRQYDRRRYYMLKALKEMPA